MDLFAVNRYVAWRLTQFDSVASHCQHDHFDIVANDDQLIYFATENKHCFSLVKQIRSDVAAATEALSSVHHNEPGYSSFEVGESLQVCASVAGDILEESCVRLLSIAN